MMKLEEEMLELLKKFVAAAPPHDEAFCPCLYCYAWVVVEKAEGR